MLDDIGADAIKTGMLGGVQVVERVARLLDAAPNLPAVIDPVMAAKGGRSLLARRARAGLRALLVPRAALLTPNAPEAAALTGLTVDTTDDLRRAGEALLALGARAVLMKGGHIAGRIGHRRADDRRRRDHLRRAAHRHPPHPRHRLHPGLGLRHGPRPGPDPGGRRRPRLGLHRRGHPPRARAWAPATAPRPRLAAAGPMSDLVRAPSRLDPLRPLRA